MDIPEIDSSECYNKIKNHYYIDDNLVIAIITKKDEIKNYHKMISYSFYDPALGSKLFAEDICKNDNFTYKENLTKKLDSSKVNINYLQFLIDQNIDVFNLSSAFYTDICFHFYSPFHKDIALKDRILLCFPNVTLCDEGCQIKGVNLTSFKAICECRFSNIMNSDLYGLNALYVDQIDNLKNIIIQTNIEIIKCYKDIIHYKFYSSNIGFMIIFCLIIIQVIFSFLYLLNRLFLIKKYIFDLTDKYLSYLLLQKKQFVPNKFLNNNKKNLIDQPPKKTFIKNLKNNFKEDNLNRKKKKGKTFIHINKKSYNKKYRRKHLKYKTNAIIFNNDINLSSNNNKISLEKLTSKENELFNTFLYKEKYKYDLKINLKNDLDVNFNEYLKTEIDDMDFEDAIKRDNRKFLEYFTDRLKTNQIILNTFWFTEPLKPKVIKIMYFILEIDLYLFINALFINEDYVNQIYYLTNEDNFLSFIPRSIDRILYATIVRVILNYIIDCISVEEKKIKGIFKREKNNELILKYEITQIIKRIRKFFLYFIIICFIIMFFSLYHIFCFNNIYPHMKIEWIKSSITIIFIMQILSILLCFLECAIRFISFKCKSERIYKISLLIS